MGISRFLGCGEPHLAAAGGVVIRTFAGACIGNNRYMAQGISLRMKLTLLAVPALAAGAGSALLLAFTDADLSLPVGWVIFYTSVGGLAWIGTGLFAWWRRPDNRYGSWMVATGFVWLAQSLLCANSALLFTLGIVFSNLFGLVIVHAIVRFPTGELETRLDRWAVNGVAAILVIVLAAMPFSRSGDMGLGPRPHNLLMVTDSPATVTVLLSVVNVAAIAVVAVLIRSFLHKFRQAGAPGRRLLGPVYLTSAVLAAALGLRYVFSIAGLGEAERAMIAFCDVCIAAVPVALLVGMSRSRLIRGEALGRMLERVARESDPEKKREAIAGALGDPSAELGFWLPGEGRFVTATGEPLVVPAEGSGRTVSEVRAEGREVAVIIHDGDLLEEPEKIDAVCKAAALALENVRLEAEVHAHMAELRASRARIVEATDAARRQLERDLHDGAQQNLVALALKLRLARSRIESDPAEATEILTEASADLETTLAELRELARGIHPAILSDRGLPAALLALAHRAPIPVEVRVLPSDRLPARIEAAAYYVVAESLTNTARHAEASRAQVEIVRERRLVRVRIADDGMGGAATGKGSGINGLSDRVAALDGRLTVTSTPGSGTEVTAMIPVPALEGPPVENRAARRNGNELARF